MTKQSLSLVTAQLRKELTIGKITEEKTLIPSNLNQFIEDIIQAYHGNWEEISQGLDAIEWYAGIFGETSSQVIKELIVTKMKLTDEAKKQELITQVNETQEIEGKLTIRINWFNGEEKRRQNHIIQ